MRRIITLVILASFLLIGVMACGGGGSSSSPTAAVKGFISALEKNDTEAMKKYATDETVQMMAMFGTKAQEQMVEFGKATDFKETIDGDEATVEVKFANGTEEEFDLIKVDGKWKVTIKK